MPRKFQQSADGFIDEIGFDSPTARKGQSEEDSRTLAELAASVMEAAGAEHSETSEESTAGSEPEGEAPPEGIDSGLDEPPEAPQPRSRRRWAAVIVVALLLFAGGVVALGSGLGDGDSSTHSEGASESGAVPPEGESPGENSGALPPGDQPLEAVVANPAPSLTPTVPPPTPAPAPAPAFAPAPTPTVAPVATPTVAPAANAVHVANLIPRVEELGTGHKVRVSVTVYVHDSYHRLISGVSVSGQWTDPSGANSCTGDAATACVVETGPLSTPGIVTFTVTGITYDGYDYKPALNHDADGDSNGTSITVKF